MASFATKYFGTLDCERTDLFDFPQGLPGFEEQTTFVLLNLPSRHPLVFLQSTQNPQLCFLGLPIFVVDPDYELSVSVEDLSIMELKRERQPQIGTEVMVLALLSIVEGQSATANLMAPIVLNLSQRIGAQAIRCDFRYSHQHQVLSLVDAGTC